MKRAISLLGIGILLFSCNSSTKDPKNEEVVNHDTTVDSIDQPAAQDTRFAIEDIPYSDVDLGEFPFFSAPEGATYINNVKVKAFDFIVFVTPNAIFEVEGKTFRAWVHEDRDQKVDISGRYLFKSYHDAILKAGGVQVFEGVLENDRLNRYNTLCTYAGSDGTFTPTGDQQIATYVIRRKEGNIYIALEKKDFPSTSIQIVQEKPFQQTITKITSKDIVNDLNEKGKSILYINFDVDQSTITSEGKEVVNQISEALKQDTSLKIAIEGHTDNTGNSAHNKNLSNNRAKAVMQVLTASGIDKNRLTAKGLGADNPLLANDSEENKAKNRRVELIKVQ